MKNAIFILFLLCSVVLILIYERHHHVTKVQLHLNEQMSAVLKENDLAWFDPQKRDDYSNIIWPRQDDSGELFAFTYNDPDGAIRLPPARLIWMREYGAIVTSVDVTVSPQKQSLEQLSADLNHTAEQFKTAGWSEDEKVPSLAVLTSSLAKTNGSMNGAGLASYSKGATKAQLLLSVPGGVLKPDLAKQNEFVLEVRFHNQALQDRQSERVYRERSKVNGNIDSALPLSYWID